MRQVLKLAGVVIVILISCVWLVLAGVIPDSSADSHRNKENLRTIALALQNYYANYDAYPSPDFAGHSWRIVVCRSCLLPRCMNNTGFMNHGIQR